jgi:MYXO-CTERM domain-containing protein
MPSLRLYPFACALALSAVVMAVPRTARACDSAAPERYRSASTVWCVNPGIWAEHQAEVESFFPYGDQVVAKLIELFAISPDNLPYTIEVMEANGYAMTPSNYGPGVAVTGDAFYNEYAGVQGFWGHLLVLHEFVNQWTGLVTGGWPTDWWADHRSPFPNSMDEQIMRTLGLNDAADAHHDRFANPQSGDYDPEVAMFNELFEAHGFAGLRRGFELIQDDGLKWDGLRDPPDFQDQTRFVSGNPSALLSNYVTAYLSLGAGENLTGKFVEKTVGAQPPNWNEAWTDTTPTNEAVTSIASAHCAIAAAEAAGDDVGAARERLQRGDHEGAQLAATGDCAQNCPSECACKTGSQECVPPWVEGAVPQPGDPDAGPGTPGDGDAGAGTPGAGDGEGGCGCHVGGGAHAGVAALWMLLGALGLLVRWTRQR